MGDATPPAEHHDIIILGAGLSGINAAHALRKQLPHRPFTILEARPVLGGTWSFFKYPGFRSDSSMSVFGLKWFVWPHADKVGRGDDILRYLQDAVDHSGLRDKIRFRHKVVGLEWRSEDQLWTIDVDADGVRKLFTANFVIGCTGYYSYERALPTVIPGLDNFTGQVVHPQWWPKDLDYSNKRIAVIGSGATAVTIVPPLAREAAHVTMIQRSPAYILSEPMRSPLDAFLRFLLPLWLAHTIVWWIEVFTEAAATEFFLKYPRLGRWLLTMEAKKRAPKGVDVDVHFNPSYGPFEQRVNLTPDGEFFNTLAQDNCELVTDVIQTVTKDSVVLMSGKEVKADIIITATGLYVQLLGGMTPVVDGAPILPGEHFAWRGCMMDSLPNMAFIFGYVTSSWTPGADMMTQIILRVLRTMERKGATTVVPVADMGPAKGETGTVVNAKSNYLLKAADRLPRTTGKVPWYGRLNLFVDSWAYWFGSMEEGMMYSKDGVAAKRGHAKTD